MILSFKQKFKDGTPTNFKEKILAGTKIHTLRESDRITEGMYLHMAYGVRTKHYQQFNTGIESLSKCVSRQRIVIDYGGAVILDKLYHSILIGIEGKLRHSVEVDLLIKNDGLTKEQFIKWFFPNGAGRWIGNIIHWTDFKY